MRYSLLLAATLLITPSCQVAEDIIDGVWNKVSNETKNQPHGTNPNTVKKPKAAATKQPDPVASQPLSRESGWQVQATAADIRSINGGKGSQTAKVFHDFDIPSSLAVASLSGSRWDVAHSGQVYRGFDTIHTYAATAKRPGRGFAFSKAGDRFAFLASRNGKTSYFIDGEPQPTFGADTKKIGPLVFSDDGVSYAYTIDSNVLVVDGKKVIDAPELENGPKARVVIQSVGFAAGTHDLHYVRQIRSEGKKVDATFIVSGSRRIQINASKQVAQAGFFRNGTPYWFEPLTTPYRFATFVVDGKAVGLTRMPRSSSKPAPPKDRMSARLADATGQQTIGIYIWSGGHGTVHPVPEAVRSSPQVDHPLHTRDSSRVMYATRTGRSQRLVVDQLVSSPYEFVRPLGFTAGGHGIAIGQQGGRSFVLLDGKELKQSHDWRGAPTAEFAEEGNGFLLKVGSNAPLLCNVRNGSVVMQSWQQQGKEHRRNFTMSDDGTKLLWQESKRIRSGSRDEIHTVMVNGEAKATTEQNGNAAFLANRDASVVLWPVQAKTGRNIDALVNGREIGSIYRLENASFSEGSDYAFTTNQPIEQPKPRQQPTLVPLVCVNGAFFAGLKPLYKGGWTGDTFHVIGVRGEGASGEIVLASYQAK